MSALVWMRQLRLAEGAFHGNEPTGGLGPCESLARIETAQLSKSLV